MSVDDRAINVVSAWVSAEPWSRTACVVVQAVAVVVLATDLSGVLGPWLGVVALAVCRRWLILLPAALRGSHRSRTPIRALRPTWAHRSCAAQTPGWPGAG